MLFVIFLKNGGVNFIFYILKPKAVAAAGNKADASWNFLNYTLNRILLMDGNFFFSVSHTGTWTAKIRGQPEALKGGGGAPRQYMKWKHPYPGAGQQPGTGAARAQTWQRS